MIVADLTYWISNFGLFLDLPVPYVSGSPSSPNCLWRAFASELESTPIKVNAACPGFTSTYLNNFRGTRTVQQAAREPLRLALLDAKGSTGTFSNEDGPLPW